MLTLFAKNKSIAEEIIKQGFKIENNEGFNKIYSVAKLVESEVTCNYLMSNKKIRADINIENYITLIEQ